MIERKTVSQCVSSDYCKGWNDAVDAMENNEYQYETGFVKGFEAARPKWISVEERLPSDFNERVLVHIEDGNCIIGNPDEDTDRFDPIRRRWVRYGDMVTHWMPLPEPPKEDA